MNALELALKGGVELDNPAYNPKTKAGRLQPPTIIVPDYDADPVRQFAKGMAANVMPMQYNLNKYNNDNFLDYNVFPNKIDSREELEKERARNQSALEQTGNALVQAVGNEIVLGIAKGFSDLFDIATIPLQAGTALITGEEYEQDYTNAVSSQIEEWQNNIRDKFAIYQEDPNNPLAFTDWGWYMSNVPSIATTVSLLVPARTITGGLSLLSKSTRLGRKTAGLMSKGQAKLADKIGKYGDKYGIKALNNKYAVNKSIEQSSELLGTAALMRTQENYMEARGVYQNVYDNSLLTLQNMSDKQREEFFKRNPNYVGMTDEDIAKDLAGTQAAHTFWADYAMLGMDVIQLYGLKNMWTSFNRRPSTGGLTRANREAAASLTNTGQEAIQNMSKLRKVTNKLIDPLRKSGSVAYGEIGEGFEEAYQTMISMMNEEDAKKRLDPNFKEKTISDFITDGEIINSAIWGWLGGVVFQAAGSRLGKLSKRIRNISDASEEKQRTAEIESRANRLATLKQNLDRINKGIPYGTDINDLNNYDPVTGELINKLTEEDKVIQKRKLIKEFARETAIEANRVGNAKLLEDYMNDENIAQYFKEQYGDTDGQAILAEVRNSIKDVNDRFDKHYYRMNELGLENPFIKQFVAEQAVRTENDINSYTETINDLQSQIDIELNDYNENNAYNIQDDQELRDFYRHRYIDALLRAKGGIDEQIADIEKQLKEGKISETEFKIRNKRINKIIQNLINIANPDYNGDRTKFNAKLNEYITGTGQYKNIELENKSLATKIYTREKLIVERDKLSEQLIRTDKQYKDAYKKVEEGFNIEKNVRIDNAIEQIANIMDKYDENEVVSYLYGRDSNIISDTDKKILDDNKIYLDINDIENGSEDGIDYNSIRNLAKAAKVRKDKLEAERKKVTVSDGNNTINHTDDSTQAAQEEIPTAPQEPDNEVTNNENDVKPPVEGVVQTPSPVSPIDQIDTSPIPEVPGAPVPSTEELAVAQQEINLEEPTPSAEELAAINQFEEEEISQDPSFIINDLLLNASRELGDDKIRFINDDKYINDLKEQIKQNLSEQGFNITPELEDTINKRYNTIAKAIRRRIQNRGLLSDITGNEELIEIIGDNYFLYDYINSGRSRIGKNGKVYINVTDFFDWLVNNENYTPDIAYTIFKNVRDIFAYYKDKIVVRGTRNFFKADAQSFIDGILSRDRTLTTIDEDVNIALSNNINVDTYNTAFSQLNIGDEIEGDISNSGRVIQFKKGNTQIGYMYIFPKSNTLNGYVTNESGFTHTIYLDNGVYRDTVRDEIIDFIFNNNTDPQFADLIFDYYGATKQEEDAIINQFLANNTFKQIISNIKTVSNRFNTDVDKARFILNSLKPIINYDTKAATNQDFINSYRQWLQKVYANYESTARIADDIRSGRKRNFKVSKINRGIKNTTTERNTFNSRNVEFINDAIKDPTTEQRLQLAYVDVNGIITLPALNGQDTTKFGFTRGHVMFRTVSSTGNYDYQKVYGHQLDSSNPMYNRVKGEINWLFNARLNGTIGFDELFTKFVNLFGGNINGANIHDSGQLFDGLRITRVTNNGNTSINIWGNINGKKTIIATMYQYKNKSDKNSYAISFLTNSGKYITFNKDKYILDGKTYSTDVSNMIDNYTKFIVDRLRFSQSYQLLDTLNLNTKTVTNSFVSLENGKFTIKFDHEDKGTTYNNYLDYIVSNSGFDTFVTTNSNRTNYTEATENTDGTLTHHGSLAINVNAVTEGELTRLIDEEERFINDVTNNILNYKSNVNSLLEKLGLDTGTIDLLDTLSLIPETINFDRRNKTSFGSYKKGKGITLFDKWFKAIGNKNTRLNDGVRTILHERIHQLMGEREWDAGQREEFTNQILGVFKEFEYWYNSQDDNTKNSLKDFIDVVKKNKDNTAAEEFFIEAITNPRLAKVLNTIKSQVNTQENKNKTLWQQIVEFLSKLLGGVDINADSLLGRISNIADTIGNYKSPVGEVVESTNTEPIVDSNTKEELKPTEDKANETVEHLQPENINPTDIGDGVAEQLLANKTKDDSDLTSDDVTYSEDNIVLNDEDFSNIDGSTDEFSYSNIYDATRLLGISNEAELMASQVLETTKFSC